ncbi:MAG TPA: helix-turn-helix domain-containing protein [Micromonosporaceae bacterium]|nr:helix-turn-helix domain-containing protein [Micromonosporaceae bacterium]
MGDEHDPRPRRLLPVLGQEPAERADAARNRRRILAAAAEILATRGAASLSLDELARVAGVGVGTVYRRFGDRAGLLAALVDEREKRFQQAFMSGPPPLGPGAPPRERIRAFLHALLDRQEEQWELLLLAETSAPKARYAAAPYRATYAHLVTLVAQARPDADAEYLAEALLALLAPSLINFQVRRRGLTIDRVKRGLDEFLRVLA